MEVIHKNKKILPFAVSQLPPNASLVCHLYTLAIYRAGYFRILAGSLSEG